jgi:sialate O-acetylesterase
MSVRRGAGLLLLLAGGAHAEVILPALFGDHMVLQAGVRVPMWGWAAPGEAVTVEFRGERHTVRASASGEWLVYLGPLVAGGPDELRVAGETWRNFSRDHDSWAPPEKLRLTHLRNYGVNVLTIRDVMVGEVWLCGGQSNMEWPVAAVAEAERELAGADRPRLRLFTQDRVVASQPQRFAAGRWAASTAQTVRDFSAVCAVFGQQLQDALGVPVGLLDNSWDGTYIESWIPREALERIPESKPWLELWHQYGRDYPAAQAEFARRLEEWERRAAAAKAAGRPIPASPGQPRGPGHKYRPYGLFNGMVAPLAPYGLRGVAWYHGEGNAERAAEYETLLVTLIGEWRAAWRSPDLPFLIVQLPNYAQQYAPAGAWAAIREAQAKAAERTGSHLTVTLDLGDSGDIHPRRKRPFGERLAATALGRVYGRPGFPSMGPVFQTMKVEGPRVRLRFRHAGGLRLRPREDGWSGFLLAGGDRVFHRAARAWLEGEEVLVESPAVPRPAAVRYAWEDDPPSTLTDATGLPAPPFRTDQW